MREESSVSNGLTDQWTDDLLVYYKEIYTGLSQKNRSEYGRNPSSGIATSTANIIYPHSYISFPNVSEEDMHKYAEPLQHTTYHAQQGERGGFYTWHQDAGDVPYENNGMIRKLSMSIQLTDPDEYEGGNFQWIEDVRSKDTLTSKDYTRDMRDYYRQIPNSAKQKGSLLLFPSFVHHQVTPVTSGTRTSLVGWFCGHPYR